MGNWNLISIKEKKCFINFVWKVGYCLNRIQKYVYSNGFRVNFQSVEIRAHCVQCVDHNRSCISVDLWQRLWRTWIQEQSRSPHICLSYGYTLLHNWNNRRLESTFRFNDNLCDTNDCCSDSGSGRTFIRRRNFIYVINFYRHLRLLLCGSH